MPDAIIVDLDGTLADVGPARHYVRTLPFDQTLKGKQRRDFEAFHKFATTEAEPNWHVVKLINSFYFDVHILFVTGRHEKWRDATVEWLDKYDIAFDSLFMRPDGDFRKDYVLKEEIYNNLIVAKYKIVFAVDDNPAIVALWRRLGIPVFVVPGWDD